MDTDFNTLFNLCDSQPDPVAGSLLVARPTIADPCFGRSVILVLEHSGEGTLGLILNRRTQLTVGELLREMADGPLTANAAMPIYMGGPVKLDEMIFVHDLSDADLAGGQPVGDSGLSVGGDFDALLRLLAEREGLEAHARLCVGYSGWESGQLRDEIDRHDWVVLDKYDAAELLTMPYDTMWSRAVEAFGDRYRLWRNWPVEPRMN